MKQFNNKTGIIFLLVMIFVLPGLSAHFFYHHPELLKQEKTNKGVLIEPPIQLSFNEKYSFIKKEGIAFNNGDKWKLVLWQPSICDEHCIKELDRLSRIRLALGRKLYSVDVGLLGYGYELDEPTKSLFQKIDIHYFLTQETDKLFKQTRVLIIDPKNFLVLAFKPDVNPKDIFHDLKRLLNSKEKTI